MDIQITQTDTMDSFTPRDVLRLKTTPDRSQKPPSDAHHLP
jgi:hypothetical protein